MDVCVHGKAGNPYGLEVVPVCSQQVTDYLVLKVQECEFNKQD